MTKIELIDRIDKEFMDVIYEHIPNKWIPSHGSSDLKFHARLSERNVAYKSSEYFYSGKRKFVHWTNVPNLMSIINSREIRLYNLQKSSDENEFNFAAKQLTIPQDCIDHSKNYLYTFSFCEIKEVDNQKLWKEYGNNYSGIAIEFEIENDPANWNNFMLSKCYYELPEKFIQLFKELETLKNKWKGIETNIDLGRLIAFHKHPDFENEVEVRLSSYFPFDNIEAYWKHCNTEFIFEKNRPRITDYFGLKLWVNNNSPYLKSNTPEYDRRLQIEEEYYENRPKIIINNIKFGENCGIDNSKYSEYRQKLEEVFKLKFGYEINLPLNLIKNTKHNST